MFRLFKRTKIEKWEVNLLKNTIQLLPKEYLSLEKQIIDGLHRGVREDSNYIQGYVSFSLDGKLVEKFENKKDREYKITDIKVFDKKSKNYLKYSIYVYNGLIVGYSIEGAENFNIDESNIDIEKFKKEYRVNKDYEKLEKYLTSAEKLVINRNEVYEVLLNDKTYFHIMDLEDGDFIGMDYEKNLYEITHDPFGIRLINRTLQEVFQSK